MSLAPPWISSPALDLQPGQAEAAQVRVHRGRAAGLPRGIAVVQGSRPEVPEQRRRLDLAMGGAVARGVPDPAPLAGHLANPDLDARFEFGLRILLDGLEDRTSGPARY